MRYKLYVIYHIVNKEVAHLVYGGMASGCILARFKQHFQEAWRGVKYKDDYIILNRDNLRVAEYARFETLEETCEGERLLIAELRSTEVLNLNATVGGQTGSLGYKYTPEQLERLRAARAAPAYKDMRKASMNSPISKENHRAARSTPTYLERRAEIVRNMHGAYYPGTNYERIRGIVPDRLRFQIILIQDGKRTQSAGYANPGEAIETLHNLQTQLGIPLSPIPASYNLLTQTKDPK